ncbi:MULTISPECIES: AtpZ/AtpI family protein [Hymenobacter]|uniref:AtpZ/AtpI family protein n=2 Tax=Hymenobacter TaxID=89966 RepID=A0ABS6WXZ1_9BACT|nr:MULTISPECIES: AtpZ/AtpI family protein [Hymenobacter]MBO3272806.1 AtpZ/AtpI family protein [Hymenobacter defluvii]MBW3127916.1 AtpZ/AtpI family protein [Hymenobacter profundi]
MAVPTPSEPDFDSNNRLRALAKYSGLGFQMLGIIGVFTFIGIKLDDYLHTKKPWWTVAFVLVGVIGAMYQVIRSVTHDE